MERYAQLVNGIINQVIESETDPDGINGEWIACGNAGPGWSYNGNTFESPVAPPVPVKYLSKLGFRNRFTPQEKALIEFAALDDPAAVMSARMLSASIRATLADQRDATYIDPTRPETRQGVIGMEAGGLLIAGRALEILDDPIEDHEMFKG